MSVEYYELYQVGGDYVTADLLIWQRYRRKAPGMVEKMLDANPQLALIHRETPFIPAGTLVRLPIDPALIRGKVVQRATSGLWTDKEGYRL